MTPHESVTVDPRHSGERLPNRVTESLGEDRRLAHKVPLGTPILVLAKAVQPTQDELFALVRDGWSVLKPPTVTVLQDGIEYDVILTRVLP